MRSSPSVLVGLCRRLGETGVVADEAVAEKAMPRLAKYVK
jgi:hypothetical protein